MATAYKGTLRGKRKNELVEMAAALGLAVDEDAAKRDDVETQLKNHLMSHRASLQNSPQWSGVYHSIDQSDKRAARSSSSALSPDSDASDDGTSARKHTQKSRSTLANGAAAIASTPLRRTSNIGTVANDGASNIASAFSAKARRSIEDLSAAFRTGATGIRDEVSTEVHEAVSDASHASTQAKRSARKSVNRFEKRLDTAFIRARNFLSDAENITAILLIVEAVLLVTHIMPLTSVRLGQNPVRSFVKNAATGKGAAASPRLTLTVPNLWVLLTGAFWRPVFLWTVWTVAIPLAASHLITFDRKHERSAVTFSLVRLAILSLVSKSVLFTSKHAFPQVVGVAAGEVREAGASLFGSWLQHLNAAVSYDYVAPFLSIEMQILFASLTTAFATYEVLAHRPRA